MLLQADEAHCYLKPTKVYNKKEQSIIAEYE